MGLYSLERGAFERALTVRSRPQSRFPVRLRAALLIGSGLLIPTAPAWAANECGPPPPGGGTVTCPAGEYPTGIDYAAPSDLEILLEPGVVTRNESTIDSLGDLRIDGPANTSLNAAPPGPFGSSALTASASGSAFVHLDEVVGSVSLSGSGPLTFIADSVASQGPAIFLSAGSGGVSVEADRITTTGDFGHGVFLSSSQNPTASISTGSISLSGANATGILSFGGVTRIESGSIAATGPASRGILAFGEVTIVSGLVSIEGGGRSSGIVAQGFGTQALDITSDTLLLRATPAGFGESNGIFARTEDGDIDVASGSLTTHGDHTFGILARSDGGGDLRITSGSLATTGDDAWGIWATTELGNVSVTSGTISTAGRHALGISASTDGFGRLVQVTSGSVTVTGGQGTGISAGNRRGDVIIDSGSVHIIGGSTGIYAGSELGGLTITSGSIVASGGTSAIGIRTETEVYGFPGQPTNPARFQRVTSGSIDMAGDNQLGIYLLSSHGNITLDSGSITIRGISPDAILIEARAEGANVTVDSGSIDIAGINGTAIRAHSGGDMLLAFGSIDAIGINTRGIEALASNSLRIKGGRLDSEATAVTARSYFGDISAEIASISTFGELAVGLDVAADTGDIFLDIGSILTSGPSSAAIRASGGTITVLSDTIATHSFDSTGIEAHGIGSVTIDSGSITTSGTGSAAIIASSDSGDVTVDSRNILTLGPNSPGIRASGPGIVHVDARDITVAAAGSDAIIVEAGTSSAIIVRGLVQSGLGLALQANGGAATLNIAAGGTILGRIDLTDSSDRVAVSGLFDAIGISEFGGADDLLDIETGGTLRSTRGAAALAGLEALNSRGLIDLLDGAPDDRLTLAGGYSGQTGARLALDVDFDAGTADTLVTGAATGSTLIDIRPIGGTFTLDGEAILLVDAGSGTSPNAFVLADRGDTPYLRIGLRFAAATNDFLLVQGPGAAVFETARFGAMAANLWHESADAVAAQLDTARDRLPDAAGRRRIGLWVQGWTGEREREAVATFESGGVADAFDVSYEQDFQGIQGGVDFQAGSFIVGLTAGAGRADSTFSATGNPVDMKSKNAGLYAQLRMGRFHFNAIAKRDWARMEIAPGAGLGARFDADLLGIQINGGARFDLGGVYAEPSVGLAWAKARIDSFDSGPATVDPGNATSLRARAGLRVGARLDAAGGQLSPFASLDAYEELGDANETDFILGQSLQLFDEPAGTRGAAAVGLNFVTGGVEAFARGEVEFGGEGEAKSLRAGVRLRF